MVLVASCFSLRLFRMGGVQKMVSGGVAAGFVLYVATKVVGDLGGVGLRQPDRRRVVAGRCRLPVWGLRASAPGGRLMGRPIDLPDHGGRRAAALLLRLALALALFMASPGPRWPSRRATSQASRGAKSRQAVHRGRPARLRQGPQHRLRRPAAWCSITNTGCCRPIASSTIARPSA